MSAAAHTCDRRGVPTPLEIMQAYLAAARSGDMAAAYGFYADDIAAHVPGRSALAGELRGRDAVIGYIEHARAHSHGAHVDLDVVDILASEERVALIAREVFHLPAGDVEIRRSNVYRVRGGQIVELSIYEADQYAVDALLDGTPAAT